mmetsp:Transcript_85414/g.151022  ORF Transcript_85414/g.151022 Transcript_85414/m.151022 type:complete len:358 (-) Transcript_85414:713-1786(-)
MRPTQEELLLLVEFKAILVGGCLWVCPFAAAIVIGKRIYGHVFVYAVNTSTKCEKLREVTDVFVGHSVDHLPAVVDISVVADIFGSFFRRELTPPFLVDEVPWNPIQHRSQVFNVVIDGGIKAKHCHTHSEEFKQVFRMHVPHLCKACVPIRHSVHVARCAVVLWTQPTSVRPYAADALHFIFRLVMKHPWLCFVPAAAAVENALPILAPAPALTRRWIRTFLCSCTWRGHMVQKHVNNNFDTDRTAPGHHVCELLRSARTSVQSLRNRLVLGPPLISFDVLDDRRNLHRIEAIRCQVFFALFGNVRIVPLPKLHKDRRSNLLAMKSSKTRLVIAHVAEDRSPLSRHRLNFITGLLS